MAGLSRRRRDAALTAALPNNLYLALSAGDPGDDASGFVEANTIGLAGYNRILITTWDRFVPNAGDAAFRRNLAPITWTNTDVWLPSSTRAVSHIAVFDDATSVLDLNYYGSAFLRQPRLMNAAGITITVPVGNMIFTIGLQQS